VIVLRYLPREGLFGLSVDLEEVSHACFKASGIVVFNQRNNIGRVVKHHEGLQSGLSIGPPRVGTLSRCAGLVAFLLVPCGFATAR
jgi:hypothetical protein